MQEDLKSRTLVNITYNGITTFFTFGLQFVANIVLSRNLSAEDYGVVGFAYILINFLTRFEDLGINSAVIRREKVDDESLGTGLTIKTVISVFLFIFSVVFAPFARSFFDNPNVILVIRLLSLNFLINLFSFLPNTILTRDLDYRKINIARISSRVVNSLLSIILALSGFKFLSIVIANLVASLILIIVLNFLKPKAIKFAYNRQIGGELISFGWRLSLSGILIFLIFNVDNFVVGLLKGSNTLGYYIIAFNWGSMICSILWGTVNEVLFPTFAKLQTNMDSLKTAFLKTLEYVSFISVIANILLLIISREFLFFILGKGSDKWIPAISALRILCIYGIIRSLLEPLGNVLMAVGRTDLLLKANLIAGIIEVGLVYPVIKYAGIEGVAVLVTVAYLSQYLVYWPFISDTFKVSIKDLLGVLRAPIGSALLLLPLAVIYGKTIRINGPIAIAPKLLLLGGTYVVSYGYLTRWSTYKNLFLLIKQVMHSKRNG